MKLKSTCCYKFKKKSTACKRCPLFILAKKKKGFKKKKKQKSSAGQLHHVEVYVSNLARSLEFWGWLLDSLGYELYQEWEQGQSWKLGHTYLVFVQREEKYADREYHRCGPGLNHLAFHAKSRRQVDTLTEQLRERGYTILYEDRHPFAGGPDYYAVFCEDPERIKVEIVAP